MPVVAQARRAMVSMNSCDLMIRANDPSVPSIMVEVGIELVKAHLKGLIHLRCNEVGVYDVTSNPLFPCRIIRVLGGSKVLRVVQELLDLPNEIGIAPSAAASLELAHTARGPAACGLSKPELRCCSLHWG